jgi:hypothetical protein
LACQTNRISADLVFCVRVPPSKGLDGKGKEANANAQAGLKGAVQLFSYAVFKGIHGLLCCLEGDDDDNVKGCITSIDPMADV